MTRHTLLGGLILTVVFYTTGGTSTAPSAEPRTLGQVHFPTSCSVEAQEHIDDAVSLLHVFRFSAALRTFNTVLETDASCTMGYWGLAMSLLGNPLAGPPPPQAIRKGAQVLQQAKPVGVRTECEYEYMAAVSLFYKDTETDDHRARTLAYAQAMERLAARYPDETEAAIFSALALHMTVDPADKAYAVQHKAATILWPRGPGPSTPAQQFPHELTHPVWEIAALLPSHHATSPATPHAHSPPSPLHLPSGSLAPTGGQ